VWHSVFGDDDLPSSFTQHYGQLLLCWEFGDVNEIAVSSLVNSAAAVVLILSTGKWQCIQRRLSRFHLLLFVLYAILFILLLLFAADAWTT